MDSPMLFPTHNNVLLKAQTQTEPCARPAPPKQNRPRRHHRTRAAFYQYIENFDGRGYLGKLGELVPMDVEIIEYVTARAALTAPLLARRE